MNMLQDIVDVLNDFHGDLSLERNVNKTMRDLFGLYSKIYYLQLNSFHD